MKKFMSLLGVAVLAGGITLGSYKLFLEPENQTTITEETPAIPNYIPTNYNNRMVGATDNDFTIAAAKTVDAVVHVKHLAINRSPRNYMEYLRNSGVERKEITGAGSGVIITEDGYIVTNNHVIAGAAEVQITLNNNKTYTAEVIGSDPKSDIALIKIDADKKLKYIPFGDSNNAKIGEWVLAVGNPFNLTSTVTAGIVSAKSRDLNEYDSNPQSFIQTDAAINPGNSGGALVNIKGELIGINTAITSQTGSYVGYAFAVPSNNAKKIVEDLIEYGDVQKGIIGISGGTVNQRIAKEYGFNESQGVFVGSVEKGSGADKGGIKEGDLIKAIDGIKVRKFADLTGYVSSKRPNDIINIKVIRDKEELILPVTLSKYNSYKISDVGVEVANATSTDLERFNIAYGVVIKEVLTERMQRYKIKGLVITEIDNQKVENVDDVKRIIERKSPQEDVTISFIDWEGEKRHFVFGN